MNLKEAILQAGENGKIRRPNMIGWYRGDLSHPYIFKENGSPMELFIDDMVAEDWEIKPEIIFTAHVFIMTAKIDDTWRSSSCTGSKSALLAWFEKCLTAIDSSEQDII